MKRVILLFCLLLPWSPAHAYDLTLHDVPVSIYFSPNGGAQDAIINAIGQARESVWVQAYSFTNVKIAKALVQAFRRGVKVEAVLDQTQRDDAYKGAEIIKDSGIPTYFDSMHSVAHNKIILIDGTTVITGSFNFTNTAEKKNAENVLIIKDKALTQRYMENWVLHRGHSEKY